MRALVIGADGGIGRALMAMLARRGDHAQGTTRRQGAGDGRLRLDLADPAIGAVALPAADIAYFCAAMTRLADCRAEPETARRINVTAPATLAQRLVERGTRVVLLSTSAVFDGTAARVPAARPPCPLSVYGGLKAEAEAAFLVLGPLASVVRLTKVLRPGLSPFAGWIAALHSGESITAFADLPLAPIALDDVVAALIAVAGDGAGGIYQLSGAADISHAEAAQHLAWRVGAAPELVMEGSARKHGIPEAEIPRFTSLDTARVTALTGRGSPEPRAVFDRVFGPAIDALRSGSAE